MENTATTPAHDKHCTCSSCIASPPQTCEFCDAVIPENAVGDCECRVYRDEAAHTPGPWTLTKGHYELNGAYQISGQSDLPDIGCVYGRDSNEEAEANARLIAAAPELRVASQQLYDRLQDYLDVSDDELIERGYDGLVEAMDTLEAAWHKADGTKHDHE